MDELGVSSEVEIRLSTIAVDARWSDKKFSPSKLVDEFKLPQVAKFEDVDDVIRGEISSKIDFTKPVIVYSQRRRTKVRNMRSFSLFKIYRIGSCKPQFLCTVRVSLAR